MNTEVLCALCAVTLNDGAQYEQHLESKKHNKNAQSAELQALRNILDKNRGGAYEVKVQNAGTRKDQDRPCVSCDV